MKAMHCALVIAVILSCTACAMAQENMTPEDAAARAAEDAAMDARFLPVCVDYYDSQLAQAGHDSSSNRFHRHSYLEHCLKNMKEQARKRKEEEELKRQKEKNAGE